MHLIGKDRAWFSETLALSVVAAGLTLGACSDDAPNGAAPGTGGASPGTGGKAPNGTGGKATGGTGGKATGGSGGTSSGGTSGTGGKATGGVKGDAGGADGSDGADGRDVIDGGDAGCGPSQRLVYRSPGCDGTVKPVCYGPDNEGGGWTACLCDGTTVHQFGVHLQPFRHFGACEDGATLDASRD